MNVSTMSLMLRCEIAKRLKANCYIIAQSTELNVHVLIIGINLYPRDLPLSDIQSAPKAQISTMKKKKNAWLKMGYALKTINITWNALYIYIFLKKPFILISLSAGSHTAHYLDNKMSESYSSVCADNAINQGAKESLMGNKWLEYLPDITSGTNTWSTPQDISTEIGLQSLANTQQPLRVDLLR